MKIAVFDRNNSKQFNGGDTVQIKAIVNFLKEQGHIVDLFINPVDLSSYDMVFIFNLQRPHEALLYASVAKFYSKPYILFPIYWDMTSLEMKDFISGRSIVKKSIPTPILSLIKGIRYYLGSKKILRKYKVSFNNMLNEKKIIRYILDNALYIIPNSEAESLHLEQIFGRKYAEKIQVIYNGSDIDTDFGSQTDDVKVKYNLPDSYICCIGGIGPRKNQMNLVKAARNTDINLIIVGKASANDKYYEKNIKKLATDNIIFLGELKTEDIYWLLKNAKGHIQPSYIETPGISSVEAMLLDCPICVSDVSPVKEYFGDNAVYCSPYSIDSIKEGLRYLNNQRAEYKRKVPKHAYHWNKVLLPLLDLLESKHYVKE
ncbi:glycosyltransferase [Paenibacillus camerounensis]|uniref:glycosyltransferase n=1 Tax=Paenibacillus camerounensis TaxID=1243663 RepID=UPI000AAB4340|nr:glycosyltransferase [Paenibacillus camerounensis]